MWTGMKLRKVSSSFKFYSKKNIESSNQLRVINNVNLQSGNLINNWSVSSKCHHPHILSSRIRSCAIFVKWMPRHCDRYILLPDSPLYSCTTNVFNTINRRVLKHLLFTKQYKCPPYLYRDVEDETITLFYIHFFPKLDLWLLYIAIKVLLLIKVICSIIMTIFKRNLVFNHNFCVNYSALHPI